MNENRPPVVRSERKSRLVLLECGCEVRCDHLPPSERLVTCEHGLEHIVRAVQPQPDVEYKTRRRT